MAAQPQPARREMHWPRVLFYMHVHIFGVMALFLLTEAKLLTVLFSFLLVLLGLLSVTAGAHRLWAHRSYEANTTLKVILMLCHTLVGQGTIYDWVLTHRIHHKHYGTDSDPHNESKGFVYSHLTTHVLGPHPKQKELEKEIDMEDMDNDSVVQFQKNFYWLLMPIVCVLLPVNAPMEYWGDGIFNAILIAGFLRYAVTLNLVNLVNSAMHIWGLKPQERFPADTMLVFILTKSHWLKYHYLLPWDYQCGEFGSYGSGSTTTFIRIWAALGWAANLRTVDSDSVKDALFESVQSGRSVQECIDDIIKQKSPLPGDHFLHPAKFL